MRDIRVQAAVRTAGSRYRKLALQQAFPVVAMLLGFWLLRDRVGSLDFEAVHTTITQVHPRQWTLALLATIGSFWAVGRYDSVIHGLLGTQTPKRMARISGASAIAIAQFAGFGLLTGALVRWRMLPGTVFWAALRFSALVSASFLVGLGVLTGIAASFAGALSPGLQTLTAAALLLALLLPVLSVLRPRWLPALPPVRAMIAILFLVFVDLSFAGAALYVLMPDAVAITPTAFFVAFLLAYAAGLVCGTPGGVGPFEVTMITLLHITDIEPVLASVLAFRLVYYAIPATLAALMLIHGRLHGTMLPAAPPPVHRPPFLQPDLERDIWLSHQPELNLVRQGNFVPHSTGTLGTTLVAQLGQSVVALRDPGRSRAWQLPEAAALQSNAQSRQRSTLLYKCSARTAAHARRWGWATIPVVDEAVVAPARFSTEGADKRQLRRMLRKAEKAGLTIQDGGQKLPLDDMATIAREWAATHDGERGFSMGIFEPRYVQSQAVYLATIDGRILGFVTLNETRSHWSIDLMRHSSDAPDGTMHSLFSHVLEKARIMAIEQVSLAAVPHKDLASFGAIGWLWQRLGTGSGNDGLRRFKSSFSPTWKTLYAAAPSKTALASGMFDVLRAIQSPK